MKRKLPPELYRVAFEKGTESPFSGKYVHEKTKGMYKCAVCGSELFSSDAKFDSGTGWPSFAEPFGSEDHSGSERPANLKNIELKDDLSDGMRRTEVLCKKCGAHLGHVFEDGPKDGRLPAGRQGKRYCINSVCLELERKENS